MTSRKIPSALVSLTFRDFRLLWLGQMSTSMGLWMDNLARGWLMYDLTGSPFLLGLTGAVKAAPMLGLGLFAGVLADKYKRKPLIIISQIANALANILLAILVVTHTVQPWHILATGFVVGIFQTFQQPARQAIVSDLVEEKYLANAIALNSVAFNASRTLGPALAGLLIAVFGVGGSYFFQAAIYIVATIWTVQMVVPEKSSEDNQKGSVTESLMEGLRYLKKDKLILALMAMALIPAVLEQPYITLMPIFAKDIMKVGPQGLGILMGAVGFGSIGGALLSATIYHERHKGPLLLGNAIIFALFLGFFAFTPWFIIALPLLFITGVAQTGYHVLNNTLIQTLSPRHLRGRILGIYFLNRGIAPLGTLLAGSMAHFMGAPYTIGIMAALGVILPVWIAISVPRIRKLQ